MEVRTITTEAELLAALTERPDCRAVTHVLLPVGDNYRPAVVDLSDNRGDLASTLVAWIDLPSAAASLLEAVQRATVRGDLAAVRDLPLRYPYGFTWVLPEHPNGAHNAVWSQRPGTG
jgi:hypothetical protein